MGSAAAGLPTRGEHLAYKLKGNYFACQHN